MRAAKQLQLDPAERQAARRLHNDVTSHLSEAGLIAGSFLQGELRPKDDALRFTTSTRL